MREVYWGICASREFGELLQVVIGSVSFRSCCNTNFNFYSLMNSLLIL